MAVLGSTFWGRLMLGRLGLGIAIEAVVDQVIADNPAQVTQYQEAEPDKRGKMIGFFVGQVMKASRGTANPQQVNKVLKDKLDSLS